jgi:CubicO group peptidase (beta-lactamase class C family)
MLDEAIKAGRDCALQVCAVRDGEVLVEAAAGTRGPDDPNPIDSDSLFPVFSVGKGVVTETVLSLVAAGRLDLTVPVAEHWPEFAANGKQGITLEQVLTHTAGIPLMPQGVSVEQMCDWNTMISRIADLHPVYRPGEVSAYHGYTFGWIVGEAVRRSLGTTDSFGTIVRRQLLDDEPGPTDFWFGLDDDEAMRVVTLTLADDGPRQRDGLLARAIPPHLAPGQDVFGRPDVRRACIPAAGGIGNARTLAAIYARSASGSGLGHRGAERIAGATDVWRNDVDPVIGGRVWRGLGFYAAPPQGQAWAAPFSAGARTFGHPGSGGSIAWGDLDTGTGFAVLRSHLCPLGWRDPLVSSIVEALTALVG